jgi:hypothetical protein
MRAIVDRRAGLLFLDWDLSTALQLTGWRGSSGTRRPWPGARGPSDVVQFAVDAVREQQRALPARYSLIEPHRLNPPVNRQGDDHGTRMAASTTR